MATSTAYNGSKAPPVAAVAQVVQVNVVRQKDILRTEQAGLVTPKSMAWWHVPTKATVDVVNSVGQVRVSGKVNQLAYNNVAATSTGQATHEIQQIAYNLTCCTAPQIIFPHVDKDNMGMVPGNLRNHFLCLSSVTKTSTANSMADDLDVVELQVHPLP